MANLGSGAIVFSDRVELPSRSPIVIRDVENTKTGSNVINIILTLANSSPGSGILIFNRNSFPLGFKLPLRYFTPEPKDTNNANYSIIVGYTITSDGAPVNPTYTISATVYFYVLKQETLFQLNMTVQGGPSTFSEPHFNDVRIKNLGTIIINSGVIPIFTINSVFTSWKGNVLMKIPEGPDIILRLDGSITRAALGGINVVLDAGVVQYLSAIQSFTSSPTSPTLFYVNNNKMFIRCPNSEQMILLRADTDYFWGDNLAQCVMTIEDSISHIKVLCTDNIVVLLDKFQTTQKDSEDLSATLKYQSSYSRFPNLTKVLIGDQCTFAEKIISINSIYYPEEPNPYIILARITLYALLRYFLGFLMFGKFTINILLRKNEELFFTNLAMSRYSGWLEVFADPFISGFGKYFKYSLCES